MNDSSQNNEPGERFFVENYLLDLLLNYFDLESRSNLKVKYCNGCKLELKMQSLKLPK